MRNDNVSFEDYCNEAVERVKSMSLHSLLLQLFETVKSNTNLELPFSMEGNDPKTFFDPVERFNEEFMPEAITANEVIKRLTVLLNNSIKIPAVEIYREANEAHHISNRFITCGQGVLEILAERLEQLEKHGKTTEYDLRFNSTHQLTKAAKSLLWTWGESAPMSIEGWDSELCNKMMKKPYRDRLVVAGALIAAEIDRIDAVDKTIED